MSLSTQIKLFYLIFIICLSGCLGKSKSERSERRQNQKINNSLQTLTDSLNNGHIRSNDNKSENVYKVIGIVDGDTYDILKDNHSVRIRMDAIDAPEKGMPYNKVSKKYLSDLIFGKFVLIVEKDTDQHGRLISQTFIDNDIDVSLEMLKAGFAWHYKKFSSNEEYSNAEILAKEKKLGLWQDPNPLPPWDIRKLHREGISTKELFKNSPK